MLRKLIFVLFTLCVINGCATHPAQPAFDQASDETQILKIYAAADQQRSDLDSFMQYVADDIQLMPDGAELVEGKQAYRQHVTDSWSAGEAIMQHEALAIHSYPKVVIVRGRAIGTFQPVNDVNIYPFETKNLFVFRRKDGDRLEVWQIIYNMNPNK